MRFYCPILFCPIMLYVLLYSILSCLRYNLFVLFYLFYDLSYPNAIPIQFYCILLYSLLSNSILFYPIMLCCVLFCLVQLCPILFYCNLSCPTVPGYISDLLYANAIPHRSIVFASIIFRPILFRSVLFCSVPSCCVIMFCSILF